MIRTAQEDFDTYIDIECFEEAEDALRLVLLESHSKAKELYDAQTGEVKNQVKWPPYSDDLFKQIKMVQAFLKTKRADKVSIHLENVKKESQPAWEKLMEIHKDMIEDVFASKIVNQEEEKGQLNETKEETKQPSEETQEQSPIQPQEPLSNIEPPAHQHLNSEDETPDNEDVLPKEAKELENDPLSQNLSGHNAEAFFYSQKKSPHSDPIMLEEFLEVDLNYSQKVIWEYLKTKLTSTGCLQESKGLPDELAEIELNSDVLESTVLKELSQMVFSCIKSKQPLQELCNEFYNDFQHNVTQRELFLIVYRNCESRLRERLTISKAEYSPVPFMLTIQEIKDEDSLPILSITSDQESIHHRRTKLDILNNIFKTSFEYDIDEPVPDKQLQHFVSCEIQFDYFYTVPQYLCFLCPCRKLETVALQRLIEISNVLFLHWDKRDSTIASMQYLRDEALKRQLKVVVFIQNPKARKVTKKEEINKEGHKYLEIEHPDFAVVANRQVLEQGLRKAVVQFLFRDGQMHIEENAFRARDSEVARLYGNSFINLCKLFELDSSGLECAYQAINELFKEILEFQGNFRSDKLFPLQVEFERLTDLENEIDKCDNAQNRQILLKKLSNSKEKMKSVELAEVLKKIIGASSNSNFCNIVRLFVVQLKLLINPIGTRIENEILEVQKKSEQNELDDNQAKERINQLECQLKEEMLSWDILVREIRRVIEFHEQAMNAQYAGVLESLIHTGEAFEILEGECLRILFDKTLACLGNLSSKKTFVVAIVGEQSTGKSTLLNYVWGTQYATSAGRCTKGIYGTILPLKDNEEYDQILLLDTEGIQSIERKEDLFFDRSLVLFLLSVSHLVIINNEGNFKEAMKNTLQITLSCWEDLKMQRVNNPAVYFVLNKLSSINPNELAQHIEKLNAQLKGGSEMKKLVKSENFHFFPQAFQGNEVKLKEKKEGEMSIETKLIRRQFLDAVSKLKQSIFHTIQESNTSGYTFTLGEWFRFTKNSWETIRKHQQLVFYTDLREKIDDKKLEEMIRNISKENFCCQEASARFEEMTKHLIRELNQALKRGEVVDTIKEDQAIQVFDKEFHNIYSEVEKTFTKMALEEEVSSRLVAIRKHLLYEQCQTYYHQILEKELKSIARENRKLHQNKSREMKLIQHAQELLKIKVYKSQEEALPQFQEEWKIALQELEKELQVESVKEDAKIYKIVMKFYHGKAGGLLPEMNQSFHDLKNATELNRQKEVLNKILVEMKGPFLFFDQNEWYKRGQRGAESMKKSMLQVLQEENNSSKLLSINDFFTEKMTFCYFKWTKCWLAQRAANQFWICVYPKLAQDKILSMRERIDNFLITLNSEAQEFGLALSESFIRETNTVAESTWRHTRYYHAKSVQNLLLKSFMKQGSVFIRKQKQTASPQTYPKSKSYFYFTSQYFMEFTNFPPHVSFDTIALGQRPILRPIHFSDLALEQFLQNIVNMNYSRFGNDQIEKAAEFITPKVRWSRAIELLDMELRKRITGFDLEEKQGKLNNEEFIDWAFKTNNNVSTRDASSELMMTVTDAVNKSVELINKTLKFFSFRMHQNAIGLLHIYAMTQTWDFLKHFSKLKRREYKMQRLGSQKFWREYFLQILIGDKKDDDTHHANLTIKEVVEKIRGDIFQQTKEKFILVAKQTLENQVQRRRLIQELDEKLFNKDANLNEMQEYILYPKAVIQSHFERKLKDYTTTYIQDAKDTFRQAFISETYEKLKYKLKRLLNEVLPKSEEACNAIHLFEIIPIDTNNDTLKSFFGKGIEDIPPTRLYNHYRKAATLFFLSYVMDEPLSETFEVNALVMNTEDEEKKIENVIKKEQLSLLMRMKFKLPKFQHETKLSQDIVMKLQTLFKFQETSLIGITNLCVFIGEILQRLDNKIGGLANLSETKANFIPDEEVYLQLVRNEYFQKLVGCGEICLECKRVCDKDHKSTNYQDDKHECRLSHQPQCFRGYQWTESQFCCLHSCECYPDNYFSTMNGEKKKWSEWKRDEYFKEWNFEYTTDSKYSQVRRQNWNRMKEAWDLVGEDVCKLYNMKFQSFKHPVETNRIPINPQ